VVVHPSVRSLEKTPMERVGGDVDGDRGAAPRGTVTDGGAAGAQGSGCVRRTGLPPQRRTGLRRETASGEGEENENHRALSSTELVGDTRANCLDVLCPGFAPLGCLPAPAAAASTRDVAPCPLPQ